MVFKSGLMSGMTFKIHPCWERVWIDPALDAIFTIEGLFGAAFLGDFLLL